MKTGVSEKGTWRVINFCVEKTRRRKPIKIPIVAKGGLADKINEIALGEKITVKFFIEGKKYNDRYLTDCIALDVEKYVRRAKYGQTTFGDETYNENQFEFNKDNSLFNQEQL